METACLLTSQEKLKDYYTYVFPFTSIYKWLSQNKNINFSKREFSLTLKNDVYIRYLSFSNVEEFKNEVIRFCPEKIDIGAIYNHKPKDIKYTLTEPIKPIKREFVIDIDLTDYDDVRLCCKEANVCKKCWKLVSIAMEIVHSIITKDFGFEQIIWIFSGRRGVHCWVSDEKACLLSQSARCAIIDYISLVKGGANRKKKVFLSYPIHSSVNRSKNLLMKKFRDHFSEQGFFNNPDEVDKILSLLPLADDHSNQSGISKKTLKDTLLNSDYTEQEKWKAILKALDITSIDNDKENLPLYELIFQYMYPRLDIHVSKTLNHLLKCPFCVHPKTGQICIPIAIEDAYTFDPLSAPKLDDIVMQIKRSQYNENENNSIEYPWEHYLNTFNKYLEEVNYST